MSYRATPKRLSRVGISRIAQRIADGLASVQPTIENIEQIVQREMAHQWSEATAHGRLRGRVYRMVCEVYKVNQIKIDSGKTYYCPELGCDVVIFKFHIERQFEPDMNWQNRGDLWEIDHIKPLRDFDLTVKRQYLECCHYKNLRPLYRELNRQWREPVPVKPLKPKTLIL